jgi:hypothetical protein
LLNVAVFSGNASNEVNDLANAEFMNIVKKVFSEDKVGFGFSESDSLKDITISEPYTILGIENEDFEDCLKNPNINIMSRKMEVTDELKTWHVIVRANGIGKFSIDFNKNEEKWVITGYGRNPYAEDFNKLFKTYGIKNVQLFQTNAPFQFYYHANKYGKNNLSQLDHKKISALPNDASAEEIDKSFGIDDISVTAKKAIEKNKDFMRQQQRGF